jgi:hypothetical protein
MNLTIPHQTPMVQRRSLEDAVAQRAPAGSPDAGVWVNGDLTEQERNNLAVVNAFWACWKAVPFDINKLGEFFAPNVTVRTGWRGEHVVQGRDNVLAMYAEEIKRQTEHGEVSDFRFPVVLAKGPIVFHTWIWIAHSDRIGYHIERPMAASYLITEGLIERWDSYATGVESEPGFAGNNGPDGL